VTRQLFTKTTYGFTFYSATLCGVAGMRRDRAKFGDSAIRHSIRQSKIDVYQAKIVVVSE